MTGEKERGESATEGEAIQEVFTYEHIADAYAAVVDTKPWNAEYDRPAVTALLPPPAGLHVLDMGCGSGWYAEYLAERGAVVTAVDITPRMVELTRARLGERARVFEADLNRPLTFAQDGDFDLVVAPLAVHYIRDLNALFAEVRRVLKPGGLFVFSTHHPFADFGLSATGKYFATEYVEDTWDVGTVRFYRRPLSGITEALASAGFVTERMLEPMPTARFRNADPQGYERMSTTPGFLVVRARRTDGEESR